MTSTIFPRSFRTGINTDYEIPSSSPSYGDREKEALTDVIDRDYTAEGPETDRLKSDIADFLGTEYCITTSSGTAALHLALEALGIDETDEVILPSYTCLAVLNAVTYTGADPVIVDVEKDSFSLSGRMIRSKISEQTGAVILVHAFGYPVNDAELYKLDVPVIDDIAGAFGSSCDSHYVGTRGIMGVGSLYATKQIASGYGGFIVTDNTELSDRIRDLKTYDGREQFRISYNYSLSDLEAAVARIQLEKHEPHTQRRDEVTRWYEDRLADFDCVSRPELPDGHAIYRYIIRTSYADEFQTFMRDKGIEVKRPVYKPLHRYRDCDREDFPVSEALHNRARLVPNHPDLTNEEVTFVCENMEHFFKNI